MQLTAGKQIGLTPEFENAVSEVLVQHEKMVKHEKNGKPPNKQNSLVFLSIAKRNIDNNHTHKKMT